MKIHKIERPREKLQKSGVSVLRNEELLAIMLRTGTSGQDVLALSKDLIKTYKGSELLHAPLWALKSKKGIGLVRACVSFRSDSPPAYDPVNATALIDFAETSEAPTLWSLPKRSENVPSGSPRDFTASTIVRPTSSEVPGWA